LALALLASFAPAATPAPQPVLKLTPIPPVGPSPITPDCRYLFVVDTSAAMQRSADGLYRASHRLIATGLGGRMQEGDVFTIWTYADTVLTREFPLNAWTRDLNIALANRAYEFLAQQKFRGKSNLRPVFAELGQALAIATNLTVILVSDGTDVVVGTPFDRPINVLYGKRASEMRSAKMPFLTALVTQHGEFTHWSVRGGLEDLGLPFPEKPVPILAPAPLVVTPAPVPVPVVFTPAPAPPLVSPATNAPPKPAPSPTPSVAKTPEPVGPKPTPVPQPVTHPVAIAPPLPKPTPPPLPAPTIVSVKPAEPAPNPAPKQEVKVAPPVAPKTSPPVPAPPAPPLAVVKPKETLVTPAISPTLSPGIVPARYQPPSVTDASNALAKVELLRPPAGTPAPPWLANPLAARIIPTQPAPTKATNTSLVTTQKTPAPPPAAPAPKPVTNIAATATTPPVPAPRLAPAAPPPSPSAPKLPEPKAPAPATNIVAHATNPVSTTVLPLPKPAARTEAKPPVVTNSPVVVATKPAAAEAKKLPPAPEAKAPAATNQPARPTGPLAVTPGLANKGGWAYLAAALVLLVLAGGIIAHLLRPRPQPSAISQSLDDQ
jgi:hypothetical protein